MSLHRLWTILRKEFRHIFRDKRTLFLVTLSPAIMLFTFAYVFATEVSKVRVGVWDLDQTATSRRLIASITADGKFVRAGTFAGYGAIREALVRGDIHLGIVIPPDFEAALLAGRRTPIQVVADGSDSIVAVQSIARFRQRVAGFAQPIVVAGDRADLGVSLHAQAWYNRDLDSMFAMVPGLIPIVMILPSLAIALALTREKELGSFETLAATPIRGLEYLLGKLIPYIVYGLLSSAIAILVAMVWFRVPLRGSPIDLGILTALYLFTSLCQSLFICGFLVSQGTAMRAILLLFFVPSFFMAGVILPVDIKSSISQFVSALLPATQYVQITRGVFLKGLGMVDLTGQALVLLALGSVPFLLSVLTFRKQVD